MPNLVAWIGELNKITSKADMYVEIGDYLALAVVNMPNKNYIQGLPRHIHIVQPGLNDWNSHSSTWTQCSVLFVAWEWSHGESGWGSGESAHSYINWTDMSNVFQSMNASRHLLDCWPISLSSISTLYKAYIYVYPLNLLLKFYY